MTLAPWKYPPSSSQQKCLPLDAVGRFENLKISEKIQGVNFAMFQNSFALALKVY